MVWPSSLYRVEDLISLPNRTRRVRNESRVPILDISRSINFWHLAQYYLAISSFEVSIHFRGLSPKGKDVELRSSEIVDGEAILN